MSPRAKSAVSAGRGNSVGQEIGSTPQSACCSSGCVSVAVTSAVDEDIPAPIAEATSIGVTGTEALGPIFGILPGEGVAWGTDTGVGVVTGVGSVTGAVRANANEPSLAEEADGPPTPVPVPEPEGDPELG